MKWLSVISYIISMTTVCCSSVILTHPQIIRVQPGEVILLRCQYNSSRIDSSKIAWMFLDHSVQISLGEKVLVSDPNKYSFMIPQDGRNQLNLQIHNAQASDNGHYSCSDQVNNDTVTHLVFVNTAQEPSVPIPFANFSDCCKAENVSSMCLPACIPSSVNVSHFNPLVNCAFDLNKLLKCFSDGRNHVPCCRRRLLPEVCLDFCVNRPPPLNDNHLQCLNYSNSIISCFEEGQVYLPSFPKEVSAIAMFESSVLVNWKPPAENHNLVTGYRVFYKDTLEDEITFKSTAVLPALNHQYRIYGLDGMKRVTVYVVAMSDKGSSVPSNMVDISLPNDIPVIDQDKSIKDCCEMKKVGATCQKLLCEARTWTRFDPDAMLTCFGDLDSVFVCLAGERNHSGCCERNKVVNTCLGLCGGSAPLVDSSLLRCITSLPVIEACVQEGLGTVVGPPTSVRVMTVGWNMATLEWDPPTLSPEFYLVQYLDGQTNDFTYKAQVTSTYIDMDDLEPSTQYEFRVISYRPDGSSLPSESVKFLTYTKPDDNIPPPTEAARIIHNVTECCMKKHMNPLCLPGCSYTTDLVTYFSNFSIGIQCLSAFGDILSCGSDGRDHSVCCARSNIPDQCQLACHYTEHSSSLSADMFYCLKFVNVIQNCFKEGIENLPRHPTNLAVIDQTKNTITITWTAPKKGPTVDHYLVKYYDTLANLKDRQANQTTYIIQNLNPDTQYKIYVISVSNSTLSPASVTLQQWTSPKTTLPPMQINGTIETGNQFWTNRTDCCNNYGISNDCKDVCLTQNVHTNLTSCYNMVDKALACASDGRDHQPCCERRGIPEVCFPFCSGSSLGINFQTAACFTYIPDITACFLEGLDLVPGQPKKMTAAYDIATTTVTVTWLPSDNCKNHCQYDVHYWFSPQDDNKFQRNVTTIQRVTSPYKITTLTTHMTYYMITVRARNSYGGGQPSPIVKVIIVNPGIPDIAIDQSPTGIISKGSPVKFLCDFMSLSEAKVFWKFNSKIISHLHTTIINNVTEADSGIYTCEVRSTAGTYNASHFLAVMYKPTVSYVTETPAEANQGAAASVSCAFKGFPKQITWLKDDVELNTSISRLSAIKRIDQTLGLLVAVLKISNVLESDFGAYKCIGINIYGSASGVTQLKDTTIITPVVPPKPPRDIKECCTEKKVPSLCMDICDLQVDINSIIQDNTKLICLPYLTIFVQCGADGRDHTQCCVKKGVLPFCQPLCSGVLPNTTKPGQNIMDCIQQTSSILGCAEEGRKLIPKAPYNVTAEFMQKKVVVSWMKQPEGLDLVHSYKIYYTAGRDDEAKVETVSKQIQTHDLTNIESHTTYTIWVVAVNNADGSSLPSQRVTVKVTELSFGPPRNFTSKMISETTVVLSWLPPILPAPFTYHIYYKIYQSTTPQNQVTTKDLKHLISQLDKGTTYVAYVVAMSDALSSSPSNTVTFTTGGSMSASRGERTSATAIGVGVAISVLCIIVAVVIFVVMRKRRQKRMETVSFENPNYGREKIKIHGLNEEQQGFDYARLNEDRTCLNDNAGTYDAVATLPVATMEVHPSIHQNESDDI